MELLHTILAGDQWLFKLINSGMSNPVFDALLPWFREKLFWAPLYLFIAAFSLLNSRRQGWIIILGMVATVGLADFTSSNLIKKNIRRIRPCNDMAMAEHIQVRVACGGGYSFTSSHAANHFGVAIFLIGAFGLLGAWQQKALLGWAGLIAFSQVYVGVHYPLDVFGGALLGSLLGWLTYRIFKRWIPRSMVFSHQYP